MGPWMHGKLELACTGLLQTMEAPDLDGLPSFPPLTCQSVAPFPWEESTRWRTPETAWFKPIEL